MTDADRIANLEQVIAQFLRPVRNVPFNVIARALSKHQVIQFSSHDADKTLLDLLKRSITNCARSLKQKPIRRPRPNEVGNDVEGYVMESLISSGLRAERPKSATGKAKAAGYPDLLIWDHSDRPTYLECKIFAYGKPDSSFRLFYLSPSDSFKVAHDARHLLLAFGVEAVAIAGSQDSEYRPRSFKLVDLYDLLCDVKYEFNSDNKRIYSQSMVIASGEL